MKQLALITITTVLGLAGAGILGSAAMRPARAQDSAGDPELAKKIVPIITVGSSLNVGVAQVQGEDRDVDRVKAVAQIETDYKDVARIKILVPVETESMKHIDRVPGVSVSAVADFAIKR